MLFHYIAIKLNKYQQNLLIRMLAILWHSKQIQEIVEDSLKRTNFHNNNSFNNNWEIFETNKIERNLMSRGKLRRKAEHENGNELKIIGFFKIQFSYKLS